MTGASVSSANRRPEISELGGALGRVAAVPGDDAGTPLAAIRLRLATRVFEAAGAARLAAAAEERAAAVAALAPAVWQALWEYAVSSAGEALAETIETEMKAAAAEARMPRRLLDRRLLTAAERRALAARLGRATARMAAPLRRLAVTGKAWADASADPASAAEAFRGWDDSLQGVARRVEAAWLELAAAEAEETARWRGEVARVAAWRRPRWPLWVVTGVVLAAAVYLGLVVGGYLIGPAFLRPLVEMWWGVP